MDVFWSEITPLFWYNFGNHTPQSLGTVRCGHAPFILFILLHIYGAKLIIRGQAENQTGTTYISTKWLCHTRSRIPTDLMTPHSTHGDVYQMVQNRVLNQRNALLWRHNGRDGVSNHQPAIVYSTVYSDADQRKYKNSASLAFVRGIHRWPVNSPHKWPVTRKMFPFDDVIMCFLGAFFETGWLRKLCLLSSWLEQMASLSQTTFPNTLSWMETFAIQIMFRGV